jgi:hypothetical protein
MTGWLLETRDVLLLGCGDGPDAEVLVVAHVHHVQHAERGRQGDVDTQGVLLETLRPSGGSTGQAFQSEHSW